MNVEHGILNDDGMRPDASNPDSSNTVDRDTLQGQGCLGSLLLFLGVGLIFLSIVERAADPPLDMPRFWIRNRSICYFFSGALFICGCGLLKHRNQPTDSWSPSHGARRFDTVVLYTREGCHLCDLAKDTLLKYRPYLPALQETSIESDSELSERFADCLPVVEIDGKVRFRGHVDEVLLRRLIEGAAST